LDARVSFQFLSHPDTWMSNYTDMDDALSDIMEQEIADIRARYAELAKHYRRLLLERQERDKGFRRRRHEPAMRVGHAQDHSEGN